MFKFQSRFLEDPGEGSLEPESESSSENWIDISTETMCSVTTGRQEPCTACSGEILFYHTCRGHDKEAWRHRAGGGGKDYTGIFFYIGAFLTPLQ